MADLSALLAVEDAARSQRGPAARVRTSGTARSLSVQYARDCVFIFGTWGDYYFILEDALAAFRILAPDASDVLQAQYELITGEPHPPQN